MFFVYLKIFIGFCNGLAILFNFRIPYMDRAFFLEFLTFSYSLHGPNIFLSIFVMVCRFYLSTKICNADMQYRYATKICNTDMQQRYAIKICNTDMQYRFAIQMCNKDMQDRHATKLCITDMQYRCAIQICNTNICNADMQHR